MPNKVFYLEPDEEITKVIDRIRKSEESGVILVIARGSSITQSIINLKLLTRNATEHGKTIGIVTSDRVTKNLADQLKLPTFSSVNEAEKARLTPALPRPEKSDVSASEVKVNTYRKYDLSQVDASKEPDGLDQGEMEGDIEETELVEEEMIDEKPDEVVPEPERERQRETQRKPERKPEQARRESREPRREEENSPNDDAEDFGDLVSDEFSEEEIVESESEGRGDFRHSSLPVPKIKETKGDNMAYGGSSGWSQRNKMRRKVLAFASVGILVVLLVAAYLFLPRAIVSVVLTTSDTEKKATFTVDQAQKETDIGNLVIPGTAVELEKSQTKTFSATGKKDAGSKASGTLTISNSISTKAVTVSPGAKAVTSDGKIYTISKGVLVPGATLQNCNLNNGVYSCDTTPGTIDATVTADATGDNYNVAANTSFTVSAMKASNKAAFTGGVTKNILYVTETDLKNAEVAMKDAALTDNKAEFLAKADSATLKVTEKYINVDIISNSANKNSGDEADTFQMTADVKLSAVGFAETDLKAAIVKLAETQITADQMLVNPDKTEPTYDVTSYDPDSNTLKINIDFKGKVGAKISSDALVGKIKNTGLGSAENYLRSQSGVESASITIWPKSFSRLPLLASRIKINFDYKQ